MNRNILIAAAVVIVGGAGAYYWTQQDSAPMVPETTIEINFGNNSYDPLQSIELSPAGQNSFTAIPLEEGGLGAGDFFKHAIVDGKTTCTYDLRITKVKGDVSERPGVDLCAATFYHFEDDK